MIKNKQIFFQANFSVINDFLCLKTKFSHGNKITVQVFDTLSCKFPQIITKLTKDTKLAFTERLERLYLIIISFILLLSNILNESN